MEPTKPTCPNCGQASIEVWTMFTNVELRCDHAWCGWQRTVDNDQPARRIWQKLIRRAARRLFGVYGFSFPRTTEVRWLTQDNPQLGWNYLADMLCQAAVARLGLPPVEDVDTWQRGKAEAEAAEWAELRGWLWTAFAPFAAEQAA